MQIQVNGEPREVAVEASVAQLLDALQLDPRTLAVELTENWCRAPTTATRGLPKATSSK